MSDPNISPNMKLPIPVQSQTVGPTWAGDVIASLNQVDSHNHSTGQGVPITPDGLNINASLPMANNYLTATKAVAFMPQAAPLSTSLIGYLYEAGVDLYYNDGSGNQIRITQSGSVAGSAGTITGLPSGTASAAFAAGTFTFQSATSIPATMNIGPIVTGAAAANSKTVTISASGSQPANYATTLPLALPATTSFLNCDASGNQGYVGATGSGSVVLATSPTITSPTITSPTITSPALAGIITGTASGIIASGAYTPTVTAGAYGSSAAAVAGSFSYTRVNIRVVVYGYITGFADSSGRFQAFITTPIPPSSNFPAGGFKALGGAFANATSNTMSLANVIQEDGTKNVTLTVFGSATSTSVGFFINFSYDCT